MDENTKEVESQISLEEVINQNIGQNSEKISNWYDHKNKNYSEGFEKFVFGMYKQIKKDFKDNTDKILEKIENSSFIEIINIKLKENNLIVIDSQQEKDIISNLKGVTYLPYAIVSLIIGAVASTMLSIIFKNDILIIFLQDSVFQKFIVSFFNDQKFTLFTLVIWIFPYIWSFFVMRRDKDQENDNSVVDYLIIYLPAVVSLMLPFIVLKYFPQSFNMYGMFFSYFVIFLVYSIFFFKVKNITNTTKGKKELDMIMESFVGPFLGSIIFWCIFTLIITGNVGGFFEVSNGYEFKQLKNYISIGKYLENKGIDDYKYDLSWINADFIENNMHIEFANNYVTNKDGSIIVKFKIGESNNLTSDRIINKDVLKLFLLKADENNIDFFNNMNVNVEEVLYNGNNKFKLSELSK